MLLEQGCPRELLGIQKRLGPHLAEPAERAVDGVGDAAVALDGPLRLRQHSALSPDGHLVPPVFAWAGSGSLCSAG